MVGIQDLCKGLTAARSGGGDTTYGQLPAISVKSLSIAYKWN